MTGSVDAAPGRLGGRKAAGAAGQRASAPDTLASRTLAAGQAFPGGRSVASSRSTTPGPSRRAISAMSSGS